MIPKPLKPILALIVLVLSCGTSLAQESETLLFEDDFQRNESQEIKDEPGGKWKTNSEKRAGGNKQVDLRDGTMCITRHATADHAVSVTHPAVYRDCRVHLRFRLDDKRDDLGIDFADMRCQEVHAGHICKIFFRLDGVEVFDFKNGRMNKARRDAWQGKEKTPAQEAELAKWEREFKHPIAPGQWHDAVVTIRGEVMSFDVDGENVGSFSSAGMAHPQKDMIRFSARREARIDSVKMVSIGSSPAANPSSDDGPVQHLFVAKLLLRRMKSVGLTADQMKEFNRLSADLRAKTDARRNRVGITPQLIKRRDEVYSELKKTDLQGDVLWKTLQERIGITDAQREAFRETLRQNKAFRNEALNLLTKEQRRQMPKGRPPQNE